MTVTNAVEGYPRQVYHPDGRTARVTDAEAEKAMGDGWSRNPSPIHQRPGGGASGSAIASGNEPLALMMREVLETVLDERGVGKSRQQRRDAAERSQLGAHADPGRQQDDDAADEHQTEEHQARRRGRPPTRKVEEN